MRVDPLLDFIGHYEAKGSYSIVWGRIKKQHLPPKELPKMTIAEVLGWQDRIDPFYMSEAAGKFQVLEDTLRDVYPEAGLRLSDLFDEKGQKKIALALMRRRGLERYVNGQITAEKFANSLAKEWASLPLVNGPKKGLSYYSGDGLNKAHAPVGPFLDAIRQLKKPPFNDAVPPEETKPKSRRGPLGRLLDAIMEVLGL